MTINRYALEATYPDIDGIVRKVKASSYLLSTLKEGYTPAVLDVLCWNAAVTAGYDFYVNANLSDLDIKGIVLTYDSTTGEALVLEDGEIDLAKCRYTATAGAETNALIEALRMLNITVL